MGQRIRKAREAAGKTQSAVAKLFDISRNAVSAWESDVSKPEASRISALADFLGTTPDYLHGKRDDAPEPLQTFNLARVQIPSIADMPLDVPVYGTARGGDGGDFIFEAGIIDYVRRPPGIARAKGVFALNVVGSSMSPRFEEGELVYLNPHLPVRIGDDVVIELKPSAAGEHGEGYLKRLVKRTATKIIVEQFNPAETIEFDEAAIKAVHRVLTLRELMGL